MTMEKYLTMKSWAGKSVFIIMATIIAVIVWGFASGTFAEADKKWIEQQKETGQRGSYSGDYSVCLL